MIKRRSERGNVFFTLFGAVAVVGVLGAGIMGTMRGPLSTMVEVNRRTTADADMTVASRLALLEAIQVNTPDGDCDGDDFVEPIPFVAGADGPTGGGFFPPNIGVSQMDPWGTMYGYCAWDAGGTVNETTSCPADNASLIDGNLSPTDRTYPVIAIISAGPDRVHESTCNPLDGGVTKGGDDIVKSVSYLDAIAQTGGLWNIRPGDPNVAEIDKDIAAEGATFSGDVDLRATPSAALRLGAASLFLPRTDDATPPTCTGANHGIMRINVSGTPGTPDVLEICDSDSTTWVSVAAGASLSPWQEEGGTGPDIFYDAGNVGIGLNNPDDALDVAGTAQITQLLTLGNNIDLAGNLQMANTNSVVWDGGAQITGNTGLDLTGNTDITGTLSVSSTSELTGNVGIGTAPTGTDRLTIDGDINMSGDLELDDDQLVAWGDKTTNIIGNATSNSMIFRTSGADVLTISPAAVSINDDLTVDNNITATNGNIDAASGNVTAGGTITAEGNITSTNGNITATGTGGVITANTFRIDGVAGDFGPIPVSCDASTQKLTWTSSGWDCGTDGGAGTGIGGGQTLEEVLLAGNDADGENALNFGGVAIGSGMLSTGTVNNPQSLILDVDGAAGASYYCDASGNNCFTPGSVAGGGGGLFENAGGVVRTKDAVAPWASVDFVFGSDRLDNDAGGTDDDRRLFFDKSKGAFRAGYVNGAQWDDTNVGPSSVAFGHNTIAIGRDSTAMGWLTIAFGEASTAMGIGTDAGSYAEVSLGRFSDNTAGNATSWIATDVLFEIGNGADTANRNNALTMLKNGNMKIGDGGNITVSDGTGGGGQALMLDVAGAVGTPYLCDEDGLNCVAPSDIGDGLIWRDSTPANNYIEYDDVRGGIRVGHVSGQPAPAVDWNLDVVNSIVYTTNGVAINGSALSTGGEQDLELDVTGDIGATNYCDADGNNCFTAADVGNVVIGIDDLTDAAKNDTAFNIFLGNTGGAAGAGDQYNIALGHTALDSLNNSGALNNIAIGHDALTANVAGGANVAIGREALNAATTDQNTAIGYQAGFNSATAATEDNLTAIGYQAAYQNTGNNVTATGWRAVYQNTGDNVTAMGQSAAQNNTGNNVTATGWSAAYQNTGDNVTASGLYAAQNNTGDNVTAIGRTAAYGNTGYGVTATGLNAARDNTGDNVTAIGYQAAFENTGNNVTAIGYQAAFENTGDAVTAMGQSAARDNTGDAVTATGFYAAYQNTGNNVTASGLYAAQNNTGNNVTATGWRAAYQNTGDAVTASGLYAAFENTGDHNTVFGYRAGYNSTTPLSGANNLFLGYQAGDATTTGSDNILIGYNVDASSATASEELNIGNILFGDIGTTSADPRIGAHKYCDENLANCFTAADVGTASNIDWDDMVDAMTLDATTTVDMDTGAADLNFDGGTLFIDSSANAIGIGTATPDDTLDVVGSAQITGAIQIDTFASCTALETDASGNLVCGTDDEGTDTFVGLTDTPADYTGAASQIVRVNAAGNGLEFVAPGTYDQDLESVLSTGNDANTLSALNLGGIAIGSATLSTGGEQDLELDVTGDIGATNYCDADGNNCFTAADVGTASNIDWDDMVDAMTLDATTTVDMDTGAADLNFDGGTLFIDSSANAIGIGTATPDDTLDVVGSAQITGAVQIDTFASCTALETDASGNLVCGSDDTGSSPFERSGTVIRQNAAVSTLSTDDFVFGSTQLADAVGTDDDSRMFFDKSKGAFRAGSVEGNEWDDMNVGLYSVAFGYNTVASGDSSTAMGLETTASGDSSTAMGIETTATGSYSTAMGQRTTASGDGSTAMGYQTDATGSYSTAMGLETTASGGESTAMGFETTASGGGSTAMGYQTEASGDGSTAMGYQTDATGLYSTAMGRGTAASGVHSTAMGFFTAAGSYAEVSLGRYSDDTAGNASSWVATDMLFEIGNGTGTTARSNAFSILKNGTITLEDAIYASCSALETDASGNLVCGTDDGGLSDGDKGDIVVSGSGATWNIDADVIDWDNIIDAMTLDATTTVDMDTGAADLNFDGGTLFIDSSANSIGIGMTNPDVELDVSGSIEYTGTIRDVSDRRLKTDILPLDGAEIIERLAQIDTYSFLMKDAPDGPREMGVMAQELEKIFPELVHTANDEMGSKSVNYVGLIAPLIEGTKELKAEIDTLKAEKDEMKAQLASISAQVELLNKAASGNVSKASGESWLLMILLALLAGAAPMLVVQSMKRRKP